MANGPQVDLKAGFLKSRGLLQRCQVEDPKGMAWWERMEALVPDRKTPGAFSTFRSDREPYRVMAAAAVKHRPSIFDDQTGCDNWACTD